METQTNWIKDELETTTELMQNNDKYVKFNEGEIYECEIDFNKKFERVPDIFNPGKTKIRIPVKHNGVLKSWDLNPANPVYKLILDAGLSGKTAFKILRTGKGKETKLQLIK